MIDVSDGWEEWITNLSSARLELLNIRMNREVQDWDDEGERLAVFARITKQMMIQDALDHLVADGLIEVDHIDTNGQPTYVITERGREVNDAYSQED